MDGEKQVKQEKNMSSMYFSEDPDAPTLIVGDHRIPWRREWMTEMMNLTVDEYPAFYRKRVLPNLAPEDRAILDELDLRELPVAFEKYRARLTKEGDGDDDCKILDV